MDNALTVNVSSELVEHIARRVIEILGERNSPWLNTAQAAEYLASPKSRIYDLVTLGKLHPERDGTRLVFARDDLDAYLRS